MTFKRRLMASIAFGWALTAGAQAGTLAQDFAKPPADARPMVRWWWFGPAVVPDEVTREIKVMKQGGFGGFEIQPVYPLSLDDPAKGIKNLTYLSDEFEKNVTIASDTARAEGMRVDITLGSGWPYGGPHIPVTEASSKVMLNKVAVPANATDVALPEAKPGERWVAAFLADTATPEGAAKATAVAFEASGHAKVAPAASDRTLLVVMQGRTGQQLKRPGVGGEGNVLDHLNATAVQHHLHVVGDRLMQAFGDHPPYAVFSDSLEVYGADWTDDLIAEFQKRRGYDLTPHLLQLFYDGPDSASVRHDWAQTLSELTDERYLTPVNDWAKAHGTRFRSQTYGIPPVTMSSARLVALPEGEGPYWRRFTSTRWASSANHLYGNTVTSAESWTWLHGAAFRANPLDIKAEADTLMLEGVNQFIAHGWPYSPPGTPEPGWAFYAAAVFNEHNPWWGVMPDVTAYLQRMSFLMRQGENQADVAVFIPTDDAFANIKPGGGASVNDQMGRGMISDGITGQILDAGFNFDLVDNTSIDTLGIKAKVLILPKVHRIDPDVYKKIEAFARSGGTVIAVDTMPDMGAGLRDADADTTAVRMISGALFGGGPGLQATEADLGKTLLAAAKPDLTGKTPDIGFVHRKLSNGDLYFVVNTGNKPVTAPLAFRAQTAKAQWWEPRTGQAHTFNPGTSVTLAPYESRVFVFGAAASAPVVAEPKSAKAKPVTLDSGWTVTFNGVDKTKSAPVKGFSSWSDDPATQFYSGTASYKRTLTLTAAQIAGGQTVLDFGDGDIVPPGGPRAQGTSAALTPPVREAAEVFVNGKRAGSVWTAPFTVDLAGFVHAGANQIEVRVANTDVNLLAGRPNADYSALTAKYGERFQAQGMNNLKPLPSGMLKAPVLTTR
jgi:hypothetical protein